MNFPAALFIVVDLEARKIKQKRCGGYVDFAL
jgi:hypothetical protein